MLTVSGLPSSSSSVRADDAATAIVFAVGVGVVALLAFDVGVELAVRGVVGCASSRRALALARPKKPVPFFLVLLLLLALVKRGPFAEGEEQEGDDDHEACLGARFREQYETTSDENWSISANMLSTSDLWVVGCGRRWG